MDNDKKQIDSILEVTNLLIEERYRQVWEEGWTPEHDNQHNAGELAQAAACYATPAIHRKTLCFENISIPLLWPWHPSWWKPTPKDRIRELVKAGALIVAEIERLQKLTSG